MTQAVPRRLFILVSSVVLIEVMFYSVLSPLLPYYVHHLHESKAAAGILTASYAIGALLTAIPAGLVVGRVGARRATATGLFLLGATCLAFGFADSPSTLDTARFIQGAASSFIWTGGLSWLVVESSAERRGEIIGSVLGIAIAGSALGPVVGSIAELAGPKPAFACLTAVIFTLGLVTLAAPQPPMGRPHPVRELLRVVRTSRPMLAGMWFTTIGALLFGVLSVLGPLHLSALGAGSLGIAATFFVSSVLEAFASPLIGRASDRRGPMPVVRLALSAASVAALLLPLPQTVWLFAPTILLAALCFGGVWVPASSLLSSAAEARGIDLGIPYALWNMAWATGQTVGAGLGARVAQVTSDAVPYLLLSALCLATVTVITLRSAVASR
jgi:MFS family permease